MAKQALLEVLEVSIGRYVKDLDAEHLNLGIWNGQVELNSLELDVDAVNAELERQAEDAPNLSLPFRVISGSFGSVSIDVPWSRLMSQPVVMRAHGLNISVEIFERNATESFDNSKSMLDDFKREKKVLESRIKSILLANDGRLRKRAVAELTNLDMDTSKNTSGNSSFSSRLVRRIIENIQVEVNDVHISLETAEGTAGILMDSLTLFTIDAKGKQSFVDRTSDDKKLANSFLHKALQIQGLGFYLDEDDSIFHSLQSISEYTSGGSSQQPQQPSHSYILAPLSFQATLRQADSNVCIDYPKYLLTSKLPSMSVILSKSQLEFCSQIAQQVGSSDDMAKPLFPEYRPLRRVSKETAPEWWKYAYRCVGRLSGRRGWTEFFLAFKRRKAYIPLYKRDAHHEDCHWLEPLTPKEMNELQKIENHRVVTIDAIMAWRNIADAQYDKEQEKFDKTKAETKLTARRSFFFGTSEAAAADDTAALPPITLSAEEMKELETDMVQSVEDELSNDSKLCNVHFVLGSFRINLTSQNLSQVASFNMGKVAAAFKANADGSFVFGLKVSSLDITDMATPNSLFPNVLCSLQKDAVPGEVEDVFAINLSKTKEGNQKLSAKLVSFQAVASPILLKEVKAFFTLAARQRRAKSLARQNPMLAKSLSGSVDLFYDANDGVDANQTAAGTTTNSPEGEQAKTPSATFSNALIEAWKSKAETQVSWVVDLDIRAPILVLPENCVNPSSNVLVLDLGHMRLEYGNIDNAPAVQKWFKEHPKGNGTEPAVDNGKLAITNLTFMVTETGSWRKGVEEHAASDTPFQDEAVVDPISIAFDFAVESVPASESPRTCTVGVVPSIVLRLSPIQASKVLNVYNAWKRLVKENSSVISKDSDTIDFDQLDQADMEGIGMDDVQPSLVEAGGDQASVESVYPVFYFSIWLQRLSLVVDFEKEGGVDAHLVSVNASMSSMSDESSTMNLSMGWFWILDRFLGRYARRQRLLAHSSLPLEPHIFAIDEKYAILDELEKLGVFKERSAESAELANITYAVSSVEPPTGGNQFEAADPFSGGEQSRIDAKFSSLFIHWNPQAIKTLTTMLARFQEYLEASKSEQEDPLLIVSGNSRPSSMRLFPGDIKSSQNNIVEGRPGRSGGKLFVIHAEMKSFEISLHSARDDLPLFIMTMSRAKISTLSSSESDLLVSLALGDCCLRTPGTGETQMDYQTLLGLAPARTESLLCVKYYSGSRAIQGVAILEQAEKDRCEAFADVELSPMRMVYIHSQVMALVEYATEGILGALAARAASSAVAAAADMVTASEAMRLYHIKATAFDFVLPQSARNLNHISIHAGDLKVVYKSLADPAGSQASVSLSDVSLIDSFGDKMQEDPIRISVEVKLPPLGVGTVEEQAMQVELDISSASFLISKSQYGQIMLTLDYNIGDYELYLRDDNCDDMTMFAHDSNSILDTDELQLGSLTHAGVAEVIIPRRMYIMIKISVLSLELLASASEPLIRIAAVDATIDFRSLFDQAKKCTKITLGNLVCDDQRPKAVKRQYQSLIYQAERNPEQNEEGNSVQDVFYICYESMENGNTNYDITIGSPRIVCVPDIVSEILDFITVGGRSTQQPIDPQELPAAATDSNDCHVENENLRVGVDDGAVEVSFEPTEQKIDDPVSTMSLSIATSRCSIVLVDLGGDLSSMGSPRAKSQSTSSQVVENLVMEGRSNAKLVMASSKRSGETTKLEITAHGDAVEIYTAFGRDMRSPLQILEPAEFSVVLSRAPQRFELRAAALTPFNICFSMRNYALISALLAGMNYAGEEKSDSADGTLQLSAKDALRIELLAKKLDSDSSVLDMSTKPIESVKISESFFKSDSSTGAKSNLTYAVSVKITLPEANLTVVNDLQGLDDALFRITIATFVAGGELRSWLAPTMDARSLTTLDCHVQASIMADYFDSSVNLWKKLLTKSWELGIRGARGASKRFESDRLSTTFDIESFPLCLSFSEQFVVSIAAASRMWKIYSAATSSTASLLKEINVGDAHDSVAERSAASSAARNLVTTLPYALENHFGLDLEFKIQGNRTDRRRCPSGTLQYFRFEPPSGLGYGGERLYGQDVLYKKSLQIFLGDYVVTIEDLDDEVGKKRRSHLVGDIVLFTNVKREGKTRVLHLSSSVNMYNATAIPLQISLLKASKEFQDVGLCGASDHSHDEALRTNGAFSVSDGILSKKSKSFGIPVEHLDEIMDAWRKNGAADIVMKVTPQMSVWDYPDQEELQGRLDFHAVRDILKPTDAKSIKTKFDVQCRSYAPPGSRGRSDPLVLQVTAEISLVDDNHLFLDVYFEPRSVLVNNLPVSISIRTPMPHTTSPLCQHDSRESLHEVSPGGKIELFTPGPSVAVNIKCADMPTAGMQMGWMESWVDLPLTPEFGLSDPLRCVFPFQRKTNAPNLWGADGCEFFIADGNTDFSEFFHDIAEGEMQKRASTAASYGMELVAALSDVDSQRTFFVTVCNYGVDHTGTVLFEQYHGVDAKLPAMPYSTFASQKHQRRITLLPRSTVPFRLLHLTMEGEEGVKRTLPFKVDNIAICEGGVSSTQIPWEDEIPSGYFAYRKLVTTDQSELHIIPEFVVFNGSESYSILVRQPGYADVVIPPGQIKPVWVGDRNKGLLLALEYMEIGGFTPPLRVDALGLRVAILKSYESQPLGSIAIQTVIGAKDSRFVVKIGDIKRGSLDSAVSGTADKIIDLKRDFLRFRVQASELEITLNEYKKDVRDRNANGQPTSPSSGGYYSRQSRLEETPVCTLLLQRFTIDWQRVFKDENTNNPKNLRKSVLLSPERSQLSLVVHSILLRDESANTTFPIVFNSSTSASFLDLCIRVRGPLDSDLIKVDLIDLNLAHINGVPQKLFLNTSEEFLWKMLDLVDRIKSATGELASPGMRLKFDVDHGGYVVSFDEEKAAADNATKYSPPSTGSIYDINKARVSPFSLILTFKRNPQAARYGTNITGGQIVKYFTQRLKFKIENADLTFASYETTNLKGPSDRLVEVLQAVYLARLKMKLVSIMTSASFQDWRGLANRNDGDDTFIEGDLLRVTGNLAGKTAKMAFRNVGKHLGQGVYSVSNTVGNTFEHATGKVGARQFGAGVNSMITGVGGGISSGIQGVGDGTGKAFLGVGKGAGQVLGGMTGGVLLMGKGVGQGVAQGDVRKIGSGISQGLNSVGVGVGQGVGTAVTGAADGFLSVGKGLFSGVRTIGKGVGGAFLPGKREDSNSPNKKAGRR